MSKSDTMTRPARRRGAHASGLLQTGARYHEKRGIENERGKEQPDLGCDRPYHALQTHS